MNPLVTVFATHNHQPNGNFDAVIEEAHARSYLPFLEVMARHPRIRFVQHWTGTLLEWLMRRHPDTIGIMQTMVERGQLELLTGSYYEAILAIIPPRDAIGQIRKLTATLRRIFGVVPRGVWLAERVWEPQLVRTLADIVEFVVLDDTHFKQAGFRDDQLRGYYVTEDGGVVLNVFPIDKTLRYTIPFRRVEEAADYLRRVASAGDGRMLVHADDGEKFGVWPTTFATVFEEGWLEAFCVMLEQNEAWLQTGHFGTILDTQRPAGRVYLPTASYAEMLKWSLPADAFRRLEHTEEHLKSAHLAETVGPFLRAGFWRGFLAKYPEANHMHKRMLRVSSRLERVAAAATVPQKVYDDLWAAQCNDPYWHGVFGGLYLPNLRFPVYHHLLRAEAALDAIEHLPPVRVERADFDCDGEEEIIVESNVAAMYFTPSSGGALVEFDHRLAGVNLLDIVTRREEGYHHRLHAESDRYAHASSVHDGVLAKETGLRDHLSYDWYRRASFLDHFFGDGTTLESVARCQHHEAGDFVNQPYEANVMTRGRDVHVVLHRNGALWFHGTPHRVSVRKAMACLPVDAKIVADYTIANEEPSPIDIWFGIEINVGMQAGDAADRYCVIDRVRPGDSRLRSRGETRGVNEVQFVDEWLGVETTIATDTPAGLWRFPVETVSLSEAGFERLYQSSVVLFHWRATLGAEAGKEFTVRLTQSVASFDTTSRRKR